jgi:hypothetical protein
MQRARWPIGVLWFGAKLRLLSIGEIVIVLSRQSLLLSADVAG